MESSDGLLVQLEMRLHQLRRRQSQPLIERYVGKIAALEYFQETQRRRSGVFDVMARGERHESDIAGLIVVEKRPRLPPPSLGRSIAWLADRRRDPTPINRP